MAASQVAQGQVTHQLNRCLGIAAVQGRPVKIILIEQTDITQERQFAVLKQVASRAARRRRRRGD